MLIYKKLRKHKHTAEKDIVFSVFDAGIKSKKDDSVENPTACKNSYNFSLADGALKTGLGFKDLEVPYSAADLSKLHTFDFLGRGITEIKWIDCYRFKNTEDGKNYYHLNVVDQQGRLWYCVLLEDEIGIPVIKSDVEIKEIISCFEYRIGDRDCILYFTPDGLVYSSAYQTSLYSEVPPLLSCAVHYDKLFGITNSNRNELVYQENLDVREWDKETSSVIQFLDQRGSFTKLVVFSNYVYLFREHGITRISEYTPTKEFTFTHLFTSTSRIFEDSICVCNSAVYFVTRDGLYAFNGSSVTKICTDYDVYFTKLDNSNCASCAVNGKYYLASRLNFDDERKVGCESENFVNNVLFEIDIESKKVEILRGVDIKRIIKIDLPEYCRVAACFNGKLSSHVGQLGNYGSAFDNDSVKVWESFATDLGYQGKKKKIKEILLTTKTDCTIEIISDLESKKFDFVGGEREQRLSVSCLGNTFKFVISTPSKECEICKPKIVFDVVV